jgi:hypothetical protein
VAVNAEARCRRAGAGYAAGCVLFFVGMFEKRKIEVNDELIF